MSDLVEAAKAAQIKLAETRAEFARKPRENSAARASRADTLDRLTRLRDEAALAAGLTAVQLDEMLYGAQL